VRSVDQRLGAESSCDGVGFGGDRRQDFRVTAGLQHSLSFPYSWDPPR